MPHPTPANHAERTAALTLAARADCDARTALRAIRGGAEAIRTVSIRERVVKGMRELGIPVANAERLAP